MQQGSQEPPPHRPLNGSIRQPLTPHTLLQSDADGGHAGVSLVTAVQRHALLAGTERARSQRGTDMRDMQPASDDEHAA